MGDYVQFNSGVQEEKEAYPRAKAPFLAWPIERPKAKALGYLEAKNNLELPGSKNADSSHAAEIRAFSKRIYIHTEFALCWKLRCWREMCLGRMRLI